MRSTQNWINNKVAHQSRPTRRAPAHQPEKHVPDPARVAAHEQAYVIDMTGSAEAVYVGLHNKAKEAEKRGDYTSAHCTVFKMVRSAIRETIMRNPIDRAYALSGDLSNIYRIKKGRYRICWIASSKLRRICILYISESLRKEGDVNDPYRIFAQAVLSGQFNDIFAKYGVRMPHLKSAGTIKSQ